MSNTISVESLPQAVVGAQVSINRDEMRDLRQKGTLTEEVDKRMGRYIAQGIIQKHHDDFEIVPIDAAFSSTGRAYRLEIVTFTRKQWVAHHNEWLALEAERDALKAALDQYQQAGVSDGQRKDN